MHKPTSEKILACPKLPTLPAVAMQVLELTRSDNVDLKNVASVIRNDQALATKVLRTVNSSYYGLTRPCTTIQHAMVYLGLNTVKTIALSFSLAENLDEDEEGGGFDFVSYWRRGLFGAAASRELARRTGACPPEETFLAALFQDVGMVALYRALGPQYLRVVRSVGKDHRRLVKTERETLELDHAEIGAALAERWKLPEQLVESVRYHHRSRDAKGSWRTLAQLVELGSLAALTLTLRKPEPVAATFSRGVSEWLGLGTEDARGVLRHVGEEAIELSKLFNLRTGDLPDTDAILQAAEERLVEHQVRMAQETEALKESNKALAQEALADPLTGLANRKRFDEELAERMKQAREFNGRLGLIICDLDRFKLVNDTYGHQAGDAVLCDLARLMTGHVGEAGVVARYGGEEFAVILPGKDRLQATALAEDLRQLVEARRMDMSGLDLPVRELAVTVSFGVAAYEEATADLVTRQEVLIRIADQALYAAKHSGRNCVRVFSASRRKSKVA